MIQQGIWTFKSCITVVSNDKRWPLIRSSKKSGQWHSRNWSRWVNEVTTMSKSDLLIICWRLSWLSSNWISVTWSPCLRVWGPHRFPWFTGNVRRSGWNKLQYQWWQWYSYRILVIWLASNVNETLVKVGHFRFVNRKEVLNEKNCWTLNQDVYLVGKETCSYLSSGVYCIHTC